MSTPLFKSIRRAAVPICAIETADPARTILESVKVLNGKLDSLTLVQWDIIRGIYPVVIGTKDHPGGFKFCEKVKELCMNPAECLRVMLEQAPEGTVLFFHNAHRFIASTDIMQAIWNVRDTFKARKSTLVLLAPSLTLPIELKNDAVIISEPLPDEAQLAQIVDSVCDDAGLKTVEDKPRVIDILRGLSAFGAEQVVAMSLEKGDKGVELNHGGLWARKKKMIEQTPGLAVWQGDDSFESIGGISNIKTFLTRVLTSGNTPVRAIGFIDEIEKGLAGSGGDTSGTSQDQLQVFLKVMQDLDIPGIILVGPPGTGKSQIAKCAGSVAKCPVVAIDTGAMKGSLVGESERRIRDAMEVFKSVSQGKGLFIATCNKIASLPPELRRRFTLGTFFVDLPSEGERATIWKLWTKRFNLGNGALAALPDSEDWSGAEIKACCDVAFRTGLSLKDAAEFVVPVIKSAPEQIAALRTLAKNRFISANHPGLYGNEQPAPRSSGRNFTE